MTFAGWAQLIALIVVLGVTAPLLGRYMAKVYDRSAVAPRPGLRSGRAADLPRLPDRSRTRAALEHLRVLAARVQRRRRSSCSTCSSGSRATCRSTRPTWRTCSRRSSFNTAVSFVTNTNWQNYSRRVDDEPPHPDGGPRGAELRVGRRGHGGGGRADPGPRPGAGQRTIGNFWVDLVRTTSASCCRSRSCSRSCCIARASIQNTPRVHRRCTPSRAPRRRSRAARSRARRRSRSSARTAAASSTPTPRTRSRTRPGSRLPRALRDPDHPVRARVHVRADGQGQAPGLRGVRGHVRPLAGRSARSRSSSRSTATRSSTRAG